jgi:hypothetical protein
MTRALVHLGLAATLVLAPALCCCQARLLGAAPQASVDASAPTTLPVPAPKPIESCCSRAKKSLCHESAPIPAKPGEPCPQPLEPAPQPCACCLDRPDAAQTESKPAIESAQPTGEMFTPVLVVLAASCPEHLGLSRGLQPPDRAGVDVRFTTLFVRHQLHC